MAIRMFSNGSSLHADPVVVDFEGPYTLAFWQRAHSTVTFAADFGTTPYVEQEKVTYDASGEAILNGIDNVFAGGGVPPLDEWHHIAMVRTSSTNAKLYIDGVQVVDNPTDVAPRGNSLWFEFSKSGNTARWLDLQNARIWTAALTLPEIAAERISLTPVRAANLLVNWEFADSSDTGSLVVTGTIQDTDGPVLSVPGPNYVTLHGARPFGFYVDENNCVAGWAMLIKDVTP